MLGQRSILWFHVYRSFLVRSRNFRYPLYPILGSTDVPHCAFESNYQPDTSMHCCTDTSCKGTGINQAKQINKVADGGEKIWVIINYFEAFSFYVFFCKHWNTHHGHVFVYVCVRCVCVLLFAFVCFSMTQFQKFGRWELKLDATLLDIMGLQAEIGLILLTKTNIRLISFNKIELLRFLFKFSLRNEWSEIRRMGMRSGRRKTKLW